jgi:hypothetical protein
MARKKDHEKAIILRKRGYSYSQIKQILKVSKSTLSGWLKEFPLSEERIRELRDHNEQRIENYCRTRRRQKEERLEKCYKDVKQGLFPIRDRELYLAGIFLYWGEGSKTASAEIALSNTNPAMIKFFMYWLNTIIKIPKEKMNVRLYLYNDMNIAMETRYWSSKLNIPISQFKKPYIKKTLFKNVNYKGGFGHGTCNLRVFNARLTEKILMTIKAISDKFDKVGS